MPVASCRQNQETLTNSYQNTPRKFVDNNHNQNFSKLDLNKKDEVKNFSKTYLSHEKILKYKNVKGINKKNCSKVKDNLVKEQISFEKEVGKEKEVFYKQKIKINELKVEDKYYQNLKNDKISMKEISNILGKKFSDNTSIVFYYFNA